MIQKYSQIKLAYTESQLKKKAKQFDDFISFATALYADPEKDYLMESFLEKGNTLNWDGTVDLFHGTTKENAQQILKEKILRRPKDAPDSYGVYFSTSPDIYESYGDGTVISVRVPFKVLEIDDEHPGKRIDYRIETYGGIYRPILVGMSLPPIKSLREIWEEAKNT